MTVSYQYDVASHSSGGFLRLLCRWKGSVWKLVYTELLLLTVLYTTLSMLYRYALDEANRKIFELVVYYCSLFMEMIPLSFLLGFYVTHIANRWWDQYTAIPWPDRVMNVIMMYVPGMDDGSRMLRRTLMRYLNLSLILVLRTISKAVRKRFPTKEHLIEAGFMTKIEVDMWQSIPSTEFNTFWIPCTWFINLLREARNECRITDAQGVKLILEEFNDFRAKCGLLWSYDWISIPLVYTQVVTLATYAFFGAALFGTQYIDSKDPIINAKHHFDFYVPIFTVIQYFLYMGLLKVAEQLINPFGDDDEDFELNWIIDRHIKVSYLGVDTLNGAPPPLVKDSYFHKSDYKLPYTAASVGYKKKTYRGSVAFMRVPQKERGMVVPDVSEEQEDEDEEPEPLSKKPSLWTLRPRRSSTPRGTSVDAAMEGGMFHQGSDDSMLHVYFRHPTPTDEDSGQHDTPRQEAHFLQVPEETAGVLPETKEDANAPPDTVTSHAKGSFIKDFFTRNPPVRVVPWTGADGNYDSPPKQTRRPQRSKFKDCIKSRSTSDLTTIGRHKDEGAAREPLATSSPKLLSRLGKRKMSLGGRSGHVPEQKWTKCTSLPSMALSHEIADAPSLQPVEKRKPSIPPSEQVPLPGVVIKQQPEPQPQMPIPTKPPGRPPLPMLTFAPKLALPAPPRPEPRRAKRDSLSRAEKDHPEPPKPSPPSVEPPRPPIIKEKSPPKVILEIPEPTPPVLKLSTPAHHLEADQKEPEPLKEPIEPPKCSSQELEPAKPPDILKPPPKPPSPPPEEGPPSRPPTLKLPEIQMRDPVAVAESSLSDESPDSEFVVLIKKGDQDKSKKLVILPTVKERASSMESLSSPSVVEAHITLPLQRSSSLESFHASKSNISDPGQEKSKDTEESDSGSLTALVAAAPVHRRVPCEVLMRWQNVGLKEGTLEDIERVRTREGSSERILEDVPVRKLSFEWSREHSTRRRRSSETSRRSASPPAPPIPPGRVKQLSQEFSLRLRATETSEHSVRARSPEPVRSREPRSRAASTAEVSSISRRRERPFSPPSAKR
ncbi:titin-like isoform X2 [Ornithodoros turicata]|uniref:titin-like isoform X2 n=1 Tax=Ornithodoros turicata TaxID=34597 RepID=UPI003138D1A7